MHPNLRKVIGWRENGGFNMPIIYLSPSTQENNVFVNGGTEEYYSNLLAAMDEAAVISGVFRV